MTSAEIRQSFLDFFKSKEHTIVPSASLMPDSPGLLFTNAGMNQFVPIFLNQRAPDVDQWPGAIPARPTRAADTQKCIRAGGKHNDLEDVGLDTYHHTFFEMLGNWSFGDYFKREAIDWAWELVTEKWKFPKERLYATVYSPDKSKGDPSDFDQEAYDFWAAKFIAAGLDPKVHIVSGNKKDNFWMMGETGPCGPCSEIHVDLTPAGDTGGALVNKGDARCIEIWNLVFIQFNANPDGTFSPLPARHVDTGMGFERVAGIMQGTNDFRDFANAKISNYETDVFRPIFDALEKLSGKKYAGTLPGEHTRPRVSPSAPSLMAPPRTEPSGEHTRPRVLPDAPSRPASEPSGVASAKYSRRNLPHFERPWAKYMVTFSTRERRQLAAPERDIVLKSILYAHENRQYELYAACVMPDHVHLLFEPQIKEQDTHGNPVFWSLSEILQGIKSASAHNINQFSGQKGNVWEKESLDRMIRGQPDMEEKFHYICRNPWQDGVVPATEDYPWLWTPERSVGTDTSGEHTRPRVSPSAPSLMASPNTTDAVDEASTAECMSGEHTRPRVSPSAPSLMASPKSKDAVDEASTATREGACAPQQSEQEKTDIAFRVIADHIRTLSFSIADGILPGNNDRNYVLRRILRRAVRYGRTLGFHEPFFYKLVEVLAQKMGDVFPELRKKQSHVQEVIKAEEETFNKTLDKGIYLFDNEVFPRAIANAAKKEGINCEVVSKAGRLGKDNQGKTIIFDLLWTLSLMRGEETIADYPLTELARGDWRNDIRSAPEISGANAFVLYDTYGFPLDLTELMARERGLTVDTAGFEKLMSEQRARARAAQKKEIIAASNLDTSHPTDFVGFDRLSAAATVLAAVNIKDKTAVTLDASPLYAEMGGQVGDTGEIRAGEKIWPIVNTQKTGNTFLHFLPGKDAPEPGATVELRVNAPRRAAIQRHHTVTHLLHWALHEVVSPDATQKGSYVGPDKLTFDFSSAALTPAQVADVEKLVNERIVDNAGVTWSEVPYAQIKGRKEVMQFFGEKYGDIVRVVQIGGQAGGLDGYSMELCGGTHTRATGEIGLFRILSEGAIAAGIRRIEAVAGLRAYEKAREEAALISTLAGKVNSPVAELEKKLDTLLTQQKEMEKQLKAARQKQAAETARALLQSAQSTQSTASTPFIIEDLGAADGEFLQAVADALKSQFRGVVVLGGSSQGAVSLVATVSPDTTAKFQAGKIIQAIAPLVGGKGGGKPDNARGGGKDAAKLPYALKKARELIAGG
jgi:alanyl-tRNA synthetase/REP element-mobilizing transposase RayT